MATGKAYYNENDPRAAEWLRQLIKGGHIADGIVDERSITEVRAADLIGYTQCHFFAGIGGWSYALRLAGWPDSRPAWTGSCPCQPFSAAGKGLGQDDPRHLWPVWFELIRQCRPLVIFGEQVASRAALSWLDTVQDDLESEVYALGAVDLCVAGVGAPHIRQRLYWVADLSGGRCGEFRDAVEPGQGGHADGSFITGGMANAELLRLNTGIAGNGRTEESQGGTPGPFTSGCGGMGYPGKRGLKSRAGHEATGFGESEFTPDDSGGSFWANCEWLPCTDGKARPVEPGSFPLAHGIPGRVGLLRGYGNAINAEAAAEFVRAYSYGNG